MRTQRDTLNSRFEPLENRTLLSTYYVAISGANGSAGSSAAPWKTLQYAADRVVAGDTVIVSAGTYAGFDLRTSGTSSARITFKAQSGAVINQVNSKTNRDGINIENASYITIDGFTLIGTNNAATSRAGIRVVGDGYGYDDGAFSENVILQNNTCDRWGYWGILTGFCDDMVIQNNVCSRSVAQHGIYFGNSGDNPTIRNNTCWGNAACGIHMNADYETGNTSIAKVDGIISGALVDGNTCYDNGLAGGSAINCDGVRNSRIVNNVLYDNHSTGIALYQIDAAAPAVGNTVANNTVINAADGRWCLLVTDGAVNTTVFNNIFYNLHDFRGGIEMSADSLSGFKSDYNLLDGKFSVEDTIGNFSAWKSTTGGDAHSRAVDASQLQALFTNYGSNDFTLAAGSAAINAGTGAFMNSAAPSNDRLKHNRVDGAWDIGAYENGSDNSAPPPPPDFATVTNGKLTVVGTAAGDTITLVRSGSSIIVTRNGAQLTFSSAAISSVDVYGNDGNDSITLGASMMGTYINAGSGNDVVQGGDARDTISGGAGKDQLHGGAGDDLLAGNQGPDTLYGESGKDRIYGGDGDDQLIGGTHNDRMWGDAGRNNYDGGAGDDTIFARNSESDTIYGGAGNDTVQGDLFGDVEQLVEHAMP